MDKIFIESIVQQGIRSFETSLSSRLVNDIDKMLDNTPGLDRNIQGLVISLFAMKQKYNEEFRGFHSLWDKNPNDVGLFKARFAEASTAFIPEVFASETLEELHKSYGFETLYEKNMYYPNIFLYMEYAPSMMIESGFYFRFHTNHPEQEKTVYLYVDRNSSFAEIVEHAVLYIGDLIYAFDCDVIPLDFVPLESEDFVYIRMSDHFDRNKI